MSSFQKRIFIFPVALLVVIACKTGKAPFSSPDGYDLEKAEKFIMPDNLLEISGIAFNRAQNDTIYSVQDEDGRLFRQAWGKKKQLHTVFGKKGDYEDLAILKENVIILKSNGDLTIFPFAQAATEEVPSAKIIKDMMPEGEYESLYTDEATSQLFVLCKNCKEDKKQGRLSGSVFTFDQARQDLVPSGKIEMDLTDLITSGAILKTGLKPSALSKDPHTGEWYILSSVNKLLVIASPDWKVKSTHRLNSTVFNQPEGIAFDKERNLYISNEGDEVTAGNILKFKRKI